MIGLGKARRAWRRELMWQGKRELRGRPCVLGNMNLNRPFRDVFFFQAEDGIRDTSVTGVQTCALPISRNSHAILPARPSGDKSSDVACHAPAHGLGAALSPKAFRRGAKRSRGNGKNVVVFRDRKSVV